MTPIKFETYSNQSNHPAPQPERPVRQPRQMVFCPNWKMLLMMLYASVMPGPILIPSRKFIPRSVTLSIRMNRSIAAYQAVNQDGPFGALGRYQMRKPGLRDTDHVNELSQWTGRHGINNRNEFLNNPLVQENALEDYIRKTRRYLKVNEADQRIDQNITGIKAPFAVTESGLVAAAHRMGADRVKEYLDHLESVGWKSGIDRIADKDKRERFLAIETRLRQFASTPLYSDRRGYRWRTTNGTGKVMRIRASIPLLLITYLAIGAGFQVNAAASPDAAREGPRTWENFWHRQETKWNELHRGHLRPYIGTYNYEAVLNDPAVRTDVEKRLGDRFDELVRNISGHRGVIEFDGIYFTLEGLRIDTGQERGMLVIDVWNDKVEAAIWSRGHVTLFSSAPRYGEVAVPLRIWLVGRTVINLADHPPEANFQWVK